MSLSRGAGLYGSDHSSQAQRIALTSGAVPVAVYGLGKMGLPLAAVYAEVTGNLTGVDIDESVVETINRGGCHIDREPGLAELVEEQVERGALCATTDADAAAAEASVHVIIVPTLVTDEKEVDLDNLESVTRVIARELDPGDTVVVECTVPPGTCRDRLLPILERESGLELGEFGLAFCPERTTSGKALRKIRREHPKIVGGADDESTRVAELIYGELTENRVIPVSDVTTAEAVKVFEGLYRDVNIALANELARLVDDLDLDVNEAIEAANTQSFCNIHTPGAGVGGHCIPYYPYFLMQQVDDGTPLVRTARSVNDSMPAFTVEKTVELLEAGGTDAADATVLVLGVTYRPNVAETRATPAGPIIDGLRGLGADVLAADPLVDVREFGATPADVGSLDECDLDAAVLVTAHDEFEAIDWGELEPMAVVDGRQALDLGGTDHRVYTIGSGTRNHGTE
ncbi:nucleotide sugar dehydrogenase [Halegenticoccus soli]|uniref:nucleotide sugar dehydrogenase n=1 Tax=Halegenticoccus soli TaxID=1985678 RepID=UPI000C6E643A|nr:nucleotide sugar dehydrogenase [Halegenticoccus soli]